jgi:hypothetical protein
LNRLDGVVCDHDNSEEGTQDIRYRHYQAVHCLE